MVGRPVLTPRESESVLGGAAVLAAFAAGLYASVEEAITSMAGSADSVCPDTHSISYVS